MSEQFVKYARIKPVELKNRQWIDRELDHAPVWCSVDLRDGNQALPLPMNPEKKLNYFRLLCQVGFKEIEVSFPSASHDDFVFVRNLVENHEIPDDVRISVLTQARESLIQKTVESLKGLERGILHLYVATSDLHSKFVFHKTREEVIQMAVDGTKMVMKYLKEAGLWGKIAYEFSPEEFTDSDVHYVVEVCKAVKETWGPSRKEDFIVNLPATVERRLCFHYADMIELFCREYPYLDETTISVHSHNDQGTAVASTEMTLLAGAERVEGTLFGHGERTGNVDIVTLALNMMYHGIDPKLDFSNLPDVVRIVEKSTGMEVHPRHPYAGLLAFTAFSGSHQDAIRKGLECREQASEYFKVGWKVPYLHIDPEDVGRKYERLIRINSQSGKGGVAYVLEHTYGIYPPKNMHPAIGAVVQAEADRKGGEFSAEDLIALFNENFVNLKGVFEFQRIAVKPNHHVQPDEHGQVPTEVTVYLKYKGKEMEISGSGNGPLSATVRAIRDNAKLCDFILEDYTEQTMGANADAQAMAFVGIRGKGADKQIYYGAGHHADIGQAALLALFSALNFALSRNPKALD